MIYKIIFFVILSIILLVQICAVRFDYFKSHYNSLFNFLDIYQNYFASIFINILYHGINKNILGAIRALKEIIFAFNLFIIFLRFTLLLIL